MKRVKYFRPLSAPRSGTASPEVRGDTNQMRPSATLVKFPSVEDIYSSSGSLSESPRRPDDGEQTQVDNKESVPKQRGPPKRWLSQLGHGRSCNVGLSATSEKDVNLLPAPAEDRSSVHPSAASSTTGPQQRHAQRTRFRRVHLPNLPYPPLSQIPGRPGAAQDGNEVQSARQMITHAEDRQFRSNGLCVTRRQRKPHRTPANAREEFRDRCHDVVNVEPDASGVACTTTTNDTDHKARAQLFRRRLANSTLESRFVPQRFDDTSSSRQQQTQPANRDAAAEAEAATAGKSSPPAWRNRLSVLLRNQFKESAPQQTAQNND